MPLLDHSHPPIKDQMQWNSLHSNWATRIADALTEILPPEFSAEEHVFNEAMESDVATYETKAAQQPVNGVSTVMDSATVATATTWAPPAPALTLPAVFPDRFEIRVCNLVGGKRLIGAIELISPGNKDRPEERLAFATKCASYLYQGVSLIILDVVTTRRANLHNETMRLMQAPRAADLPAETNLYAAAYRPVLRQERPQVDLWTAPCAVGAALPVMPLRLTGDLFVPVDFESTYYEACRRRRLP